MCIHLANLEIEDVTPLPDLEQLIGSAGPASTSPNSHGAVGCCNHPHSILIFVAVQKASHVPRPGPRVFVLIMNIDRCVALTTAPGYMTTMHDIHA